MDCYTFVLGVEEGKLSNKTTPTSVTSQTQMKFLRVNQILTLFISYLFYIFLQIFDTEDIGFLIRVDIFTLFVFVKIFIQCFSIIFTYH